MIALRHRLVHGYTDVRLELVWTIFRDLLPGLVITLKDLIPPDPGSRV